MGPTLLPAWLISFWSTNSVVWRAAAVMETQTWELPMTWANGKHGSRPAREMTKQTLSLSLISGSAPAGSSAATATFLPTRSLFHLADLMRAARTSRVG